MQILSVTLKNFKTHQDKHFTFAPGTNAICGENGAGKTSILEAIAWVLFNYVGDYAKEDLIRNGSASAEVTVEFVSNQDGRTYTVQRHTTKGYTLFDPQLNERLPYTRIKDEVLPWLRDHLGVAPGTDLGELFARTIGVPQGTFTADFLQSAENRKAVFDKVLKVEEYKTVFKEMNSLRRLAEEKVTAIDREIAGYEERLAGWEDLRTRHQSVAAAIAEAEAQVKSLDEQIDTLQAEQQQLKAQAQQIQQLQSARQQAQTTLEAKQQAIALLTETLAQAVEASKICAQSAPDYAAYQAAEKELQALGKQQTERQTLQKRQQTLQKTLDNRAADMTRLKVQLDNFEAAIADIDQLQPLVAEQTELENQLKQLQQQQRQLAQTQGELQATERQIQQQTQQIQALEQDIQTLQALEKTVEDIPKIEQQRDRLQAQISRLEAARQFEAELQRLVHQGRQQGDRHRQATQTVLQSLAEVEDHWPETISTAIASIRSTLESGIEIHHGLLVEVEHILSVLSAQTDAAALKQEFASLQSHLSDLAKQQATLGTLPNRQQQLAQAQTQQAQLVEQQRTWQQHLEQGEQIRHQAETIQTQLAALEDPKGRRAVLERSLQQRPTIQTRYEEMQVAQSGIQQQMDNLATQLSAFEDLEGAIAAQNLLKQTHQAGYLQYLQHQRAAQEEPRLKQEQQAMQTELADFQRQRDQLQAQLDQALSEFDPQRAQQVEESYQTLRSERDLLMGGLPQQRQMLAELQRQIDDLTALAQKRDTAIEERKHRDRVKRFINFARKAYKEAGPRITERYVQQISRESDRLFRELLNRPNVALTWTRDYGIVVQEGPNARRFVNLSGGEQMCAALSVRLALLKVLADIDIAFFDEPTTNMDRPRRESLAEAIARIRSFTQLFVISHDDTFEKVTENVIFVEREG